MQKTKMKNDVEMHRFFVAFCNQIRYNTKEKKKVSKGKEMEYFILSLKPASLVTLFNVLIVLICMYYFCTRFSYLVNVVAYGLIKSLCMPLFNMLMSALIPWTNLGNPFSVTGFILNFLMGFVIVKIFMKLLEYVDDMKAFIFLGGIAQYLVQTVLYYVLLSFIA